MTFDELCRNKNCKKLSLWITRAFSCNELEDKITVWLQYIKRKILGRTKNLSYFRTLTTKNSNTQDITDASIMTEVMYVFSHDNF